MGTIYPKGSATISTGSGTGESVGNSNQQEHIKVFPKTAVAYMLKTIGTYMQKKTAHLQ